MQDRLSFKQQNLSVGQHFSIAGHQAKTIHQLLERVQASLGGMPTQWMVQTSST